MNAKRTPIIGSIIFATLLAACAPQVAPTPIASVPQATQPAGQVVVQTQVVEQPFAPAPTFSN